MPKDIPGVIREFKHGELHSGSSSGQVVSDPKQAIAIALSERRQQRGDDGASMKALRRKTRPSR